MSVIAVTNQKGGVGKTTIAFNLAKCLSEKRKKVLAIDNDPQGNLTSALLENHENLSADVLEIYQNDSGKNKLIPEKIGKNLDLIGANISLSKVAENDFDIIFRLKEALENLKKNYAYVIIDCLPSFGHLNLAALNASDYVLIPTKAAPFALHGLQDLFVTIKKTQDRLNPNLKIGGILLNLLERTVLCNQLEESLQKDHGEYLFKSKIDKGVKFEESPAFNQSIVKYAKNSKQAKQFNNFLNEFLKRVKS